MRKLFNELFCIPKHGKIQEKVMLTRVIMTVFTVVMCLVAMGFTAYAYFSYTVTSATNMIQAADFKTDIKVSITDSTRTNEITLITSNYKAFKTSELVPGKYYTVTIEPLKQSTAKTGFVIVTADGCPKTYHTQQLGVDENAAGGKTSKISFKLMITAATEVQFTAHWGTSSYYSAYKDRGELYITQEDEIKMIVNGVTNPVVNTETEPETTPDETTETTEPTEETQPTEDTQPTEETTTEPETTEPTEETQPAENTQPTEETVTEPVTTEPTEETQPTENTQPTEETVTEPVTTEPTEETQPAESTQPTEDAQTAEETTTEPITEAPQE